MSELKLTSGQINNIAIAVLRLAKENIEQYYSDPENEQKFKKWYEATYNKPVPKGV